MNIFDLSSSFRSPISKQILFPAPGDDGSGISIDFPHVRSSKCLAEELDQLEQTIDGELAALRKSQSDVEQLRASFAQLDSELSVLFEKLA